jgi:Winged helix-turn helix
VLVDEVHGQGLLIARGTIMAPPLRVTLDQAAHDELDRRYQTTRDATTRTRYQMILLRAEGHPVAEVARITRRSPDTVRRVLKRYLAGGADAVPHRPHLGQPPHYPPAWQAELVRVADLDPTRLGWTVRCGAVGCWPTTWPRSPAIGRGSRRSGWPCTGPGTCASGPAGCCSARPRPSRGGQKRLRVEALLAAAASAVPPPAADLVPDATLADDLFPEDLPRLLGLLGRADLYLQDEVEVALHPTLTRVWSRAGRPGQRRVQAPGTNDKRYGFGLVDWRDGWLDFALADGRRAVPLCAQLRRAVQRSRTRGGSPW